jgi:hypothetical protein
MRIPPKHSLFQQKKVKLKLGPGFSVNVPIFANGQQDFSWSSDSRPISQLLNLYHLQESIYINEASLPLNGASYYRKYMAVVRFRFSENEDYSERKSWNLLDTRCPLGGAYNVCSKFLQNNSNCILLIEIKEGFLNAGSSGRATASGKILVGHDVERRVLIAEPGAIIGPHHDSHDDSHRWETFITANEGLIGFAWLDRPTEEELCSWVKDPQGFRGGKWCYTVLRVEQTMWVPSGLIHFVLRRSGDSRQTMAISGHSVRYTDIGNWAYLVQKCELKKQCTISS